MAFAVAYLFLFFCGACWGSFVNAFVFRVHGEMDLVKGRSQCPLCGRKIWLRDLVPIWSFFRLKFRCRHCKKKISWQYLITELVMGVLFTAFFLRQVDLAVLAEYLFNRSLVDLWIYFGSDMIRFGEDIMAVGVLMFLFIYDLKYYLVPDKIVLPAVGFFFVFNSFLFTDPFDFLIGGLIGGGFFLLQYLISSGRWIGGGDIRVGALMGVLLGWKMTVVALVLSYWTGAAVALMLIATGKKKLSSQIPFVTLLSVSSVICLYWFDEILVFFNQMIIL